jgi:hypothetical protein
MKTALAIIYNHRFDRNIPVIDRLYGDRFSHIWHLVPFYDGELEHVIPTHYGAYSFHGFVGDFHDRVDLPEEVSHVAFIGDDLILNPRLDENNFSARLGLDSSEGFIKEIDPLVSHGLKWPHVLPAIKAMHNQRNFQWSDYLPPVEEARKKLAPYGDVDGSLGWRNLQIVGRFRRRGFSPWTVYRLLPDLIDLLYPANRKPPYPLLSGYSDCFVAPRDAMAGFARLCRVFAASGIFVEVALPTALALACDRIATEKTMDWKGRELWHVHEVEEIEKAHGNRLPALLEGMPENQLYVHPVKLSRWREE